MHAVFFVSLVYRGVMVSRKAQKLFSPVCNDRFLKPWVLKFNQPLFVRVRVRVRVCL